MSTFWEKTLKFTILAGLFSILFVPFIVDRSMFFPFITGKGFTFRIIVEVIFAFWLILAVAKEEYRPKKSFVLLALIAFLAAILLSTIFSENPYKSFWSNFERMEGFITHIHLFLYFLVLGTVIDTEKLWTRFFNTSLAANVFMVGYVLMQLAGKIEINQGGVRVDGTLGNATYLAIYVVFHAFLALFFLFKTRNTYARFLYGALIAFNLYVLFETQTRGAILGLLGGMLLSSIFILWKEREDHVARKSALTVCITVVTIVGGFIAIKDTDFVKNNPTLVRFSKISVEQAQDQARYYIWPMAIKGFSERPIVGWGQENFNYIFNKYYSPEMYKHEQWFDRTHNAVLDWLVSGGLVGLLAYLSIFVFALRSLWRASSLTARDKSILTGLFSAYFFHNLFVFDNLISYILFFSVIAFIHFSVSDKKIFESKEFSQTNIQVAAVAIIIVLLGTLYGANARPILASKSLIEGLTPRKDGNITKNLEAFKRALDHKTLGDSEIREYLAQTASRLYSIPEVPSDMKIAFSVLAQNELDKQLERVPNDTRYLMFAGSLANAIGKYEQALDYLERAKKSSPGKQMIFFEIGTTYLRTGQFDKAFEAFKSAYELAPAYQEAHIIYAIGAIYARQDAVAQELLGSLPEHIYYFDDRIFKAYASRGNNQILLSILQRRIEKNDNSTDRTTRAALYLNTGNRVAAIADLQEAIKVDPSFKERGEYYIAEIKAGRNP